MGCDIKYLGAPSCLVYVGSFVVYSPPPPLEPHLRSSFLRHRAKNFCHRGNIYLPTPSLPSKATIPLFLLAFQVQTFTAAYWQLSLLASDPFSCSVTFLPSTLLLAASPACWLPFFLQRRLLTGTLLLAMRPRRYGQVIYTPPTPSSSFPSHMPRLMERHLPPESLPPSSN